MHHAGAGWRACSLHHDMMNGAAMRNKAFGFALQGSMLCVLAGWAGQARSGVGLPHRHAVGQ